MATHRGIAYLRTTRKDTPILYRNDEAFRIGGSKVLRSNKADRAVVVAAGITLHEALKAYEELKQEGKLVRVIDLYSIKPIDANTLEQAARETGLVITVEDHFAEGGLGEAVTSAVARTGVPVYSLAVRRMPRSGKPDELLAYEEISHTVIVKTVKDKFKTRTRKS
jgi:transketolase